MALVFLVRAWSHFAVCFRSLHGIFNGSYCSVIRSMVLGMRFLMFD